MLERASSFLILIKKKGGILNSLEKVWRLEGRGFEGLILSLGDSHAVMTFVRSCSEILAPSIIYSRSKHTRGAGRIWIRKLSRATKCDALNTQPKGIIFVERWGEEDYFRANIPVEAVPHRSVHDRISETRRVRARCIESTRVNKSDSSNLIRRTNRQGMVMKMVNINRSMVSKF